MNSMAASVEAVISQIQSFASQAGEDTRRRLVEKLHDVAVSLETSNDTIMRIIHQVSGRLCPGKRVTI